MIFNSTNKLILHQFIQNKFIQKFMIISLFLNKYTGSLCLHSNQSGLTANLGGFPPPKKFSCEINGLTTDIR